jgi:hypothetical protein
MRSNLIEDFNKETAIELSGAVLDLKNLKRPS